jgi:N utilization substance protein B
VAARRPSRKQARRDAVFVLYQREVTGRPLDELFADRATSEGYALDEFTPRLVQGVIERQGELDAELTANSPSWPLDRIAPLERSILRLALFELRAGDTPPEVAIDEAVRLAKRYSTDEAGALVNGILGGAQRGRATGQGGEERT